MSQQPPPAAPPPSDGTPPAPSPPTRARLTRRTDDRLLGGVAGGLADHLGLDTVLVRIGFVLLSLFGGGGVVLYLALWVLVPERTTGDVVAQRFVREGRRLGSTRGVGFWIGVALIALASIALLGAFVDSGVLWALVLMGIGVVLFQADASRPLREVPDRGTSGESAGHVAGAVVAASVDDPTATTAQASPLGPVEAAYAPPPPRARREPTVLGRATLGGAVAWVGGAALFNVVADGRDVTAVGIVGVAMAIIGVGLLVGSVAGRARWLLVVGALLLPVLAAASLADRLGVPMDAGVGTREVRVDPGAGPVVEELFAGELVIDLVDDWQAFEDRVGARQRFVTAHVGTGELLVRVPAHWNLEVLARVGAGSIVTDEFQRDGFDRGLERAYAGDADAPILVLDLAVDLGELRIDRVEVR